MNTNDENIEKFNNTIIELNNKIDSLILKRNDVELAAIKYTKELDELLIKQRIVTRKLRSLTAPSYNLWENIGDGG